MPEITKPKTRDEVMLSIVTNENVIVDKMHALYAHLPEFSIEWLHSVELNYKEFLDYCNCVVKKHQESEKS